MALLKIVAAAIFLATTVSAEPDIYIIYEHVKTAHGVLGCLAFALFFPIGAMTIRAFSFRNAVLLHATWMAFVYCLVLAVVGMGVWMAVISQQLNDYHPIIGLFVAGSLLLQPVTGLVHHLLYKKSGSPNAATYPHIWWGRAIITLGIINAGLGLQLGGEESGPITAYGVLAGLVWLLWIAVIFTAHVKSKRTREGETGDSAFTLGSRKTSTKPSNNGVEITESE